MSRVKSFKVELCERKDVKEFIEEWHYSSSINGLKIDYCFKLLDGDETIGAMIYGGIAMANVWKKYAESESDILELRRLCCIDDTPKNTESYFIGHTIRWIRDNTDFKKIISYADATYNHTGIIYQATNFEKMGMTAKGRVIIHEGRKYHDKSIRSKRNGVLKPFAVRIKKALDEGTAYYEQTKGKYIYLYNIKKKPKR